MNRNKNYIKNKLIFYPLYKNIFENGFLYEWQTTIRFINYYTVSKNFRYKFSIIFNCFFFLNEWIIIILYICIILSYIYFFRDKMLFLWLWIFALLLEMCFPLIKCMRKSTLVCYCHNIDEYNIRYRFNFHFNASTLL